MNRRRAQLVLACAALFVATKACRSGDAALSSALEGKLEEQRTVHGFPGATFGAALADGSTIGLAVGISDSATSTAMQPDSRLLTGSIGKTFAAALAMSLVAEGRFGLDDPVSKWLGDQAPYPSLPNARALTVRMLMNHTTGVPDHVVDSQFISHVMEAPDRVWRPAELLGYVAEAEPMFPAGAKHYYTDTNYILLGMVIEAVTGGTYYEELQRRVLEPRDLGDVVPSDRRRIDRLSQGYPGKSLEGALRGYGGDSVSAFASPAGAATAVLADGEFVINPQFEWTGGGLASTAVALAQWGKLAYEGKVFPDSLLSAVLDGVRVGDGVKYGLGVFIWEQTPLGPAYGHGGFFPGYRSQMMYFPNHGFAVAIQFNTNVGPSLGPPTVELLLELASVVANEATVR